MFICILHIWQLHSYHICNEYLPKQYHGLYHGDIYLVLPVSQMSANSKMVYPPWKLTYPLKNDASKTILSFRTGPFLGDFRNFRRWYIKVLCCWYRQIEALWVALFDESTQFWATRWICYLEKFSSHGGGFKHFFNFHPHLVLLFDLGGVFLFKPKNKKSSLHLCIFLAYIWMS